MVQIQFSPSQFLFSKKNGDRIMNNKIVIVELGWRQSRLFLLTPAFVGIFLVARKKAVEIAQRPLIFCCIFLAEE